jgi:hypothetical protein
MRLCPACGNSYPDDANFCPMDATRLPPPAAAAPAPAPAASPASSEGAATLLDMNAQVIAGRFFTSSGTDTPTGKVFEARDTQNGGQLVTVKVVETAVLPNASMADRALRELKQLAKVSSDRIAKVIDQGRTSDGKVYVATEPVGGRTLEQMVQDHGPLPVERATALVLQIGEALTEAQKVGVIHRDVAPRNVFVLDGDRVKLTEFGLAEPGPAESDGTTKVFGAPAYLSPEQVEGRPVDQRSNIYSLGAIFFYALTGRPPFSGDAQALLQQQLNAVPEPPSARRPGLSAEIDRVILKALEKSSGRRHLTLRQLLSEVEATAAKPAAAPAPAPAPAAPAAAPQPAHRPASQAEMAKTMMGIPSPVAAAPVVRAPAPAPAPAAAHANEGTARTMMAEAPPRPAPAAAPVASAPTMMATAPQVAPATSPATTVEKKPLKASPQVQAAVAAAQAQVAAQKAQVVAQSPVGPTAKGGFRETAWFKAGEIQEEVEKARAAADAAAGGDVLAAAGTTGTHSAVGAGGEVDLAKVDVDASDKARLSLKTGATQMMAAVKAPQAAVPGERMDEQEMLAEIDSSKKMFIVAGAIVAVVVIAVVLFLVLGKKEAPAPGKAELPPPAPTAVATAPPAQPQPAAAPTPSPPAANPGGAAPPAAAPPPPTPAAANPTPPPPTEASAAQLLDEARAAAAKDNLALAVDLVTKAVAGGADAKQVKKLETLLGAKVAKKLATAKKAKDKTGEAEAKALKARLASLKVAKRK